MVQWNASVSSLNLNLHADSCIGGIVEYYYDKGCTEKAGTSRLEDLVSAPCAPLPGVQPARYVSHICTTKDKPPVRVDSAVTLYVPIDACTSLSLPAQH